MTAGSVSWCAIALRPNFPFVIKHRSGKVLPSIESISTISASGCFLASQGSAQMCPVGSVIEVTPVLQAAMDSLSHRVGAHGGCFTWQGYYAAPRLKSGRRMGIAVVAELSLVS